MISFEGLTLKKKLVIGFCIPLFLILLIAITVYFSLNKLLKSNEWVNHTYEAIDIGNGITSSLVNMETGLRGFLVSGKDAFLEPYDNGKIDFEALLDKAKIHVADNPKQVGLLNKVETLEGKWQNLHVQVAMSYRREVSDGALAADNFKTISARTVGKEKFDGFRTELAKLNEELTGAEGKALVQLILLSMVNQETGQRGFLLSGKEASLEPFVNGTADFKRHTQEMRRYLRSTNRTARHLPLLDGLETLANAWRAEAAMPEINARREMNKVTRILSDVTNFIEQGIGKQYMDEMRGVLTKFVAAESALIVERNEMQKSTAFWAKFAAVGGAILALFIGGFITVYLTRMVLRQLGGDPLELQAVAEKIAEGDFNIHLDYRNSTGVSQSMAKMRDNLVARRDSDIAIQEEIDTIVSAASRGDFTKTIDLSGKDGVSLNMSQGLNQLLKTCNAGLSDVTRVLGAIAKGDLTQRIEADYQGAFLELKNYSNNTVTQIKSVMGEVADVVEAANNGDFTKHVDLSGKTGFFQDISNSLNSLVDTTDRGLTDVKRILGALEKGDLSQSIDVTYRGAFLELKDSSNNTVRQISEVMQEIAQLINAANRGDFSRSIDLAGKDGFFKEISASLNDLMKTTDSGLEDVLRILGALAEGDLSQSIDKEYQGSFDKLKQYSNHTVTQIDEVMGQIGTLIDEANDGNFKTHIDLKGKTGFFKTLSANLNDLMRTTDDGLADVLRILEALAKGDLSQSIDANYQGAFDELKQYSNNTVRQIRDVMTEIASVVDAGNRGDFSTEIDLLGKTGFFNTLSSSLNSLMATTDRGLADVLRILGSLAEGDLSQSIDAEYQGTFDRLKTYSNNTVQKINSVMAEISALVDAANQGDFTTTIDLNAKTGFFKELSHSLNELVGTTDSGLNDVLRVLGAMADGDLSERIVNDYSGSFDRLKTDTNTTADKLTEIISKVKIASESINSSTEEISRGNIDLSQRTEEQASALEETASSMEEMTSAVKQSEENASRANEMSADAQTKASEGGLVVSKAVAAMEAINESSKKIADIISVIDEIAFQTNLLALNAAVEAARAGEQGRGFAVVAGEVRNLAQRSAGAAKEIKDLIRDSVQKVEDGTNLVNDSGKTLNEIVEAVKAVSSSIREISNAAKEQTAGIEQVSVAITEMDSMTQQNAALAEQASAAGENMAEEAKSMTATISFFSTRSGA